MRLSLRSMIPLALIPLASCESPGPTDLNSPDVHWRFPLSSLFFGDPSLGDEGIFIIDRDRLVAIDKSTGAEVWHFESPHGPIGTEAIPISNGRIFLHTDQFVYAFDTATGSILWSTHLDRNWSGAFLGGSPTIGEQQVYAVAFGGAVYALNKDDGHINWYTEISPQPTKGIEISEVFCIGSNAQDDEIPAGALHCLSVNSGQIVWKKEVQDVCTNGGIPGRPIISEGMIIVGDQCGQLLAFQITTGDQIWIKQYSTAFDSDLVIESNIGYACLRTASCIAFSLATGDILWQSPLAASALQAPNVVNGELWVTDLSGSMFQLDALTGARVVRLDPPDDGAAFFSRPLIEQDTIYSGGGSFFYSLGMP